MIFLLQLIALGVFAIVVINLLSNFRARDQVGAEGDGPIIDGRAEEALAPPAAAAKALREYEDARTTLKSEYPALFAMLGGYLNAHTIADHGGIEGAVKEMLEDWRPRREEVAHDLAKLLADADTEEAARAVVLAACDADFDREGYKAWLSWLLSQINAAN